MEATLHGVSGLRVLVKDGCSVTVGRGDQTTVRISSDFTLSSVHFSLEVREERVLLRDLASTNGTFVNGTRIQSCLLRNGDVILAGQNTFKLATGDEVPNPLAVLSTDAKSLYAVLDAAREPRVLELLRLSNAPFYCLYQGKPAAEMELVAPYLVPLASQPELLRQILEEGWGKAWGIFLHCSEPVQVLWTHLTHSLMVTLEGEETAVYFRYYDPRVLREILPAMDAQQLAELTGPIRQLLMEDEEPDSLVRFTSPGETGKIERIAVVPVMK